MWKCEVVKGCLSCRRSAQPHTLQGARSKVLPHNDLSMTSHSILRIECTPYIYALGRLGQSPQSIARCLSPTGPTFQPTILAELLVKLLPEPSIASRFFQNR